MEATDRFGSVLTLRLVQRHKNCGESSLSASATTTNTGNVSTTIVRATADPRAAAAPAGSGIAFSGQGGHPSEKPGEEGSPWICRHHGYGTAYEERRAGLSPNRPKHTVVGIDILLGCEADGIGKSFHGNMAFRSSVPLL